MLTSRDASPKPVRLSGESATLFERVSAAVHQPPLPPPQPCTPRLSSGSVYLSGRLSDTIRSGGESVPAGLVEEALLAIHAVQEAVVVGLPDPRLGQTVAAVVVLRPEPTAGDASSPENSCTTSGAVLQRLRQGGALAGFQLPRSITIMGAGDIPRTATGKVRKQELVAQLQAARASKL